MSAVVRLPTAPRRYVRQPNRKARLAAVDLALESGKAIRFPGSFRYAVDREEDRLTAERRATLDAGGLSRSTATLLATAVLQAMPRDQQLDALAFLRAAESELGDAETKAAAMWAELVLVRAWADRSQD